MLRRFIKPRPISGWVPRDDECCMGFPRCIELCPRVPAVWCEACQGDDESGWTTASPQSVAWWGQFKQRGQG